MLPCRAMQRRALFCCWSISGLAACLQRQAAAFAGLNSADGSPASAVQCPRPRPFESDNVSACKCAEVLAYTPKYTASEAAGTPLPIRVKTLGKLSYRMHVQPVLGAKSLDVIFVQVWWFITAQIWGRARPLYALMPGGFLQ